MKALLFIPIALWWMMPFLGPVEALQGADFATRLLAFVFWAMFGAAATWILVTARRVKR